MRCALGGCPRKVPQCMRPGTAALPAKLPSNPWPSKRPSRRAVADHTPTCLTVLFRRALVHCWMPGFTMSISRSSGRAHACPCTGSCRRCVRCALGGCPRKVPQCMRPGTAALPAKLPSNPWPSKRPSGRAVADHTPTCLTVLFRRALVHCWMPGFTMSISRSSALARRPCLSKSCTKALRLSTGSARMSIITWLECQLFQGNLRRGRGCAGLQQVRCVHACAAPAPGCAGTNAQECLRVSILGYTSPKNQLRRGT